MPHALGYAQDLAVPGHACGLVIAADKTTIPGGRSRPGVTRRAYRNFRAYPALKNGACARLLGQWLSSPARPSRASAGWGGRGRTDRGESGLDAGLKRRLLERAAAGTLTVRNSAHASPAGFPFKTAELAGTLSDADVYAARPQLCDLGYLRTPYQRADGGVGYRCPAEPAEAYARKGGLAEDALTASACATRCSPPSGSASAGPTAGPSHRW